MEKLWIYLPNQFLNSTEKSFKKAVKLSNYHDAALQIVQAQDPDFVAIYDRYHPLHLILIEEYSKWKSKGGTQEGETLNVKQLLELARTKIQKWDVAVQVVYANTTPRYKAIFPDGRKPFDRGTISDKINAYQTLSLNIGADPALVAVKAEVDSTYTGLKNALNAQQGSKAGTKLESNDLNMARTEAMIMQYRNLGFLMDDKYDARETAAKILFDLETLRDVDQTIFTGTLTPAETEPVLIHTFLSDDEIRLKNTGSVAINFYLASTSGGTNSTAVSVLPGEEKTITIETFAVANYGTHRYLTAVNQSNAEETHYLVELY